MDSKKFRKTFGILAEEYGLRKAFSGWFRQSKECIVVLVLQKSSYGNYYQLNIMSFIQGLFKKQYQVDKSLFKSSMGDVNGSEPQEYRNVLDLDVPMNDDERVIHLARLFKDHVSPFVDKVLTKSGISKLADQEAIFLPPSIKEELGIVSSLAPLARKFLP
ncbi:MAG: DUF4304 domain-containing protein [Bacteroidota bacterium]